MDLAPDNFQNTLIFISSESHNSHLVTGNSYLRNKGCLGTSGAQKGMGERLQRLPPIALAVSFAPLGAVVPPTLRPAPTSPPPPTLLVGVHHTSLWVPRSPHPHLPASYTSGGDPTLSSLGPLKLYFLSAYLFLFINLLFLCITNTNKVDNSRVNSRDRHPLFQKPLLRTSSQNRSLLHRIPPVPMVGSNLRPCSFP